MVFTDHIALISQASLQGSVHVTSGPSTCKLQEQIDTAALPVIGTLPLWTAPVGSWTPIVRPFSLLPAYLVAGSSNGTAAATLSLTNSQDLDHSVQIMTNCYSETR